MLSHDEWIAKIVFRRDIRALLTRLAGADAGVGGERGRGLRQPPIDYGNGHGGIETAQAGRTSAPRIALYSHDTQGLGHVRRNLLIASVLGRMDCEPVILLLSGARELGAFAIPHCVDCMTLPSYAKDEDGRYASRSLGVPLDDLARLRRRALGAAVEAFDPDVLIVDKAPLGAVNELGGVLKMLTRRGRCRLVLGLREVLDEPSVIAQEWDDGGYEACVERYYDRVWVYGDPRVFDTVAEYRFPAGVAAKVRYSGYLNPCDGWPQSLVARGRATASLDVPAGRIVLCEVGGGQDGAALARAFLDAELPKGHGGVLVTGPLMPAETREELKRRAATRPEMRVYEFVTDCCALVRRADRVIAMGGYNTICEILAAGKPALIVPRVRPRTEQLIRARRMAELGLLDALHPDELDGGRLSAWLAGPGARPPTPDDPRIDLRGATRLPAMLEEVMGAPREEVARAAV